MSSKAFWHAEHGVAEVFQPRGKCLQTVGRWAKKALFPWLMTQTHGAKVLAPEEAVYLVRMRMLSLFSIEAIDDPAADTEGTARSKECATDSDHPDFTTVVLGSLTLRVRRMTEATLVQNLMTSPKSFNWSLFLAYAQLKSLNYVVLRHEVRDMFEADREAIPPLVSTATPSTRQAAWDTLWRCTKHGGDASALRSDTRPANAVGGVIVASGDNSVSDDGVLDNSTLAEIDAFVAQEALTEERQSASDSEETVSHREGWRDALFKQTNDATESTTSSAQPHLRAGSSPSRFGCAILYASLQIPTFARICRFIHTFCDLADANATIPCWLSTFTIQARASSCPRQVPTPSHNVVVVPCHRS